MINIYHTNKYKNIVEQAVSATLSHFEIDKNMVEIEINFLNEEEMQELNNSERNIDSVTDVLSFPAIEKIILPFNKADYPHDINPENGAVILGDMFICPQKAVAQAKEYNHSVAREIGFLTVHGVLHLLGYDHDNDNGEMEALQESILDKAGITRDMLDDISEQDDKEILVGSVAILGRPNAGKSTLINTLVGEKVAIVSWKPQTTRNRILGIMNSDNSQVAFVDTPGLHAPRNALGKFMMRTLTAALEGVDAVIYLIDGEKSVHEEDMTNIERYISRAKKRVIVAINKVDHITQAKVGEIITALSEIKDVEAIVPISALKNKNIEPLKREVEKLLSKGIKQYPDDMYTDKSMRFMAAEIIREKTLRLLDKEIPFGIGVYINKYDYREDGLIEIDANIICQKASHKPIILGKGGAMIKKIGTYARQDLETMTGSKIFLTLWVKVKEDWRDDEFMLNELGYNRDNY